MIPYGRQTIDEDDIEAVVQVLRGDWLTTGPNVEVFEQAFAARVGAKFAVAVSSGTAALHTAMFALEVGTGDEVIVPAMTFAATANSVVFQGGTPVFADVEPDTLLVNSTDMESKITSRTKALVAVDYAGQPCDYDALRAIADKHNLVLVADGCHALGAKYKGRPVGSLAHLTTFSFHPVKHITTGEGGMITTDDPELAQRMRIFRNHGISTDHRERAMKGAWHYEMVALGYNYRITDFQCALGCTQLKKLSSWIERRQEIAGIYDAALAKIDGVRPLHVKPDVVHAYHLYVVRIGSSPQLPGRDTAFQELRKRGIGVNVHYIPVHLHPYYRQTFGTGPGMCPVAEKAYEKIMSIPMFHQLTDKQVGVVVEKLNEICT